ncbi:hypothetical protein KM043_012603 [Ampulex compressa]|nr:hypothetical protein KM043_012603 [Ampulex compressa]
MKRPGGCAGAAVGPVSISAPFPLLTRPFLVHGPRGALVDASAGHSRTAAVLVNEFYEFPRTLPAANEGIYAVTLCEEFVVETSVSVCLLLEVLPSGIHREKRERSSGGASFGIERKYRGFIIEPLYDLQYLILVVFEGPVLLHESDFRITTRGSVSECV